MKKRKLPYTSYPSIKNYSEIYNAYKDSPAAESLRKMYRWSTFRDGESDKEWEEALGRTAIVYSHGFAMCDYADEFLLHEPKRFNQEEMETLLTGIMIHDWGESILDGHDSVGDVSVQFKTSEHEKKESVIARVVIDSLNVSDDIKNHLVDAYHNVVEGGNPKLHHYFKALEKTEYILTARQVFLHGKHMRSLGKQGIKNEIPMVGRVLVVDLAKVLGTYALEYPDSIGSFLKADRKTFDEMFKHSYSWLMNTTEWAGKLFDHKAAALQFKKIWKDFKRTAKITTIRDLYSL